MYDVVIVGGGPIGSRLAEKLAEHGFSLLVTDRKKRPDEPVCCTGIIGMECVQLFTVPDSVITRKVNSAKIYSPSGKMLHLQRQEMQACIVDRIKFNQAFIDRAREKGAEYSFGAAVRNVKSGDKNVLIELSNGSLIEARAAVIAAGAGGNAAAESFRNKSGDIAGGVQVEVEAPGLDEIEVYSGKNVAPGFFAWLVPTVQDRGLVGLLSRIRPKYYLDKLVESLRISGKISVGTGPVTSAGVALRPIGNTFADRMIVVGSAAGQVKPVTGGGIYYGLICADLAAESLRQGLENDNLSNKALAGYEKAWKKELGRDIRIGQWGRSFFEMLNDRQIDSLFSMVQSYGIEKELAEASDLSFDWHGKALIRLIGHSVFSKAVAGMNLPIRLIRR